MWLERTAKSCGPDVAVLALSPREAKLLGGDGGKRAVRRGEHEVSRKATAQGRPGCSASTCMLVCAFLVRNCTRDRGCSVHPVFPAPSILREGQRTMQNSGERCREKERPYQFVIAIGWTVLDPPARARNAASCRAYTVYLAQPFGVKQFNASLAKAWQSREQSGGSENESIQNANDRATVRLFFCYPLRLKR